MRKMIPPNENRKSRPMGLRSAVFSMVPLLCLGLLACSGKDESAASGRDTTAESARTDVAAAESRTERATDDVERDREHRKVEACALSKVEIGEILAEKVTEAVGQGNWGIASTCTYSTSSSPVAAELSSVASADLSSDRMFEGARDVPDLGDEAVWIPATSRLTVVDKSKNKLLRIGIGMPVSNDERLRMATAIAKTALARL